MRILWVTNRPIAAGEKKFGINATSGTWMEPALEALSVRRGYEVHVATVANVFSTETLEEANVKYYFLPIGKNRIYNYKSDANIRLWENVIDAVKPNIIMVWGTEYAHGACVLNIAKERGIKTVIEMQGIMDSVARHYLGALNVDEIREAYSLRNFIKHDKLINQQKFYYKRATIEKEMLDASRNVIIENVWGAEYCKRITPECNTYQHNININKTFWSKEWILESCAKHSLFCSAPGYPLKGLHMLIKALPLIKKDYPDMKLYVPGMNNPFNFTAKERFHMDGYVKYLMNLISRLDLKENIEFCGRLSSEQMGEYMRKSHVMIIPSAIENHSVTLREAMTIGVPCVASYVGGIPEIVDHTNDGFLYRFEDYEMMAYYVRMIFANDNLAKKLSSKSRAKMKEHLDVDKTTDSLISIYQKITGLE